jgi:hypothetical protein
MVEGGLAPASIDDEYVGAAVKAMKKLMAGFPFKGAARLAWVAAAMARYEKAEEEGACCPHREGDRDR